MLNVVVLLKIVVVVVVVVVVESSVSVVVVLSGMDDRSAVVASVSVVVGGGVVVVVASEAAAVVVVVSVVFVVVAVVVGVVVTGIVVLDDKAGEGGRDGLGAAMTSATVHKIGFATTAESKQIQSNSSMHIDFSASTDTRGASLEQALAVMFFLVHRERGFRDSALQNTTN